MRRPCSAAALALQPALKHTRLALRSALPSTPPPAQISALHIESALLEHPAIAEVAVVGLPDETYGEVRACRSL